MVGTTTGRADRLGGQVSHLPELLLCGSSRRDASRALRASASSRPDAAHHCGYVDIFCRRRYPHTHNCLRVQTVQPLSPSRDRLMLFSIHMCKFIYFWVEREYEQPSRYSRNTRLQKRRGTLTRQEGHPRSRQIHRFRARVCLPARRDEAQKRVVEVRIPVTFRLRKAAPWGRPWIPVRLAEPVFGSWPASRFSCATLLPVRLQREARSSRQRCALPVPCACRCRRPRSASWFLSVA